VLQALGLRPAAQVLDMRGGEGFYESVPLQEMLDPRTLLVSGVHGQTLPMEHGLPLRVYIPTHYGMKPPKWIARIEATNQPSTGYWVDRGWNKQAIPQIQSTIDTVTRDHVVDGRVPVGGMA
jgi:DMSO/TMAO reductase YedYZ molybdopterin-dependent catalytic subunit